METVHFSKSTSPIGTFRVASTEHGLAYLELPHASGEGIRGWLQRCVPDADCVDDPVPNRLAVDQVLEYLDCGRTDFDIPLDLRGTPFQKDVWARLLEIPYGDSCSYADVARSVGKPKAVRPVGMANNANPVALIVPCHRVIAADGSLGGYGGGADLKRKLLAMEQSRPCVSRLL